MSEYPKVTDERLAAMIDISEKSHWPTGTWQEIVSIEREVLSLRSQLRVMQETVTAQETNETGLLGHAVPAAYSDVCTAVIAARARKAGEQ